MLHNWSFKDKNPVFDFQGLRFSVQIFTDTNRYDLDANKCEITQTEDTYKVHCAGLQWAGGQVDCEGNCECVVKKQGETYTFDLIASKDEYIKRVKVLLYDQPLGDVVARRRYDVPISELGCIFRYPNGWDDLFTPLITIKNETGVKYYRSLDGVVRPKTFMVQKVGDSSIVEMIFEESTMNPTSKLTVPTWEIGTCNSVEEILEKQRVLVEKQYNLKTWEKREDVPEWARNISLVLSIHAMHWCGYIYNTYQDIIDKLEWYSLFPTTAVVGIPIALAIFLSKKPYFNFLIFLPIGQFSIIKTFIFSIFYE